MVKLQGVVKLRVVASFQGVVKLLVVASFQEEVGVEPVGVGWQYQLDMQQLKETREESKIKNSYGTVFLFLLRTVEAPLMDTLKSGWL